MKTLLTCILLYTLSFTARAEIIPLVVSTEFDNENWFPLPEEQMKSAAIDTALSRISESGRFAFLYASANPPHGNGQLHMKVSLVEPAESAKISIWLNLPSQRGTYVSTASVSLHGKDYLGIFKALQRLGQSGSEQIIGSIEAADLNRDDVIDDQLRDQIIDLNLHVIKLGENISRLQRENHNKSIRNQLIKLDTIIERIGDQQTYLQQSDTIKNQKLDAIYSEIRKLNIGSNTDNRPPERAELSDYDINQLPKLKRARELKYDKRFRDSRKLLVDMAEDEEISPGFRSAIEEELNINLPLYEAEIVKNEVSGNFMQHQKDDEYKKRLMRVHELYDSALSQPDISLATRSEVIRKKDELNITEESMNTANLVMHNASLQSLRMALRNAQVRHNVMRAMRMKGSGSDQCPGRETVEKVMRSVRVDLPIQSYRARPDDCELVLGSSGNGQIVYTFNEEIAEYIER